jgi:erythromycin esterase
MRKVAVPSFIQMPSADSLSPKDFGFLKEYVRNKRVVMLGESIHLTSEFSKVRRVAIDNLHNAHEFDLLLFEGSPIEFWVAQEDFNKSDKGLGAVREFQKTALFGLWQTEEINAVLKDALSPQSAPNPLDISSYDVQIGQGRQFSQGQNVFAEFIKRIKSRNVTMVPSEEKDIMFLDNLVSCKRKKFPVSNGDYRKARESIDRLKEIVSRAKLRDSSSTHENVLEMLPQLLGFSLEFCREVNLSQRNYTEVRDEWASKQFILLVNRIGKKTIVWAHSGHVRLGPGQNGRMSFGAYAKKHLADEIFSICMTANIGSAIAFMDASGNEIDLTERPLLPIEKLSLESKMSHLSQKDLFLPVKGNDGFLTSNETSRSEPDGFASLDALKDFDAYYFVQKISPPKLQLQW